MALLRVFLLGTPRIERDGSPVALDTRKAVALLSYLVVTAQPHNRDSLTALLWPEYGRDQSRSSLRRTLSVLRKALAETGLVLSGSDVSFHPGADCWVDLLDFRRFLAACRTHGHPETEICHRCTDPLARAAALYRDDFMAGFGLKDSAEFDDWQIFQLEDLRLQLGSLLERLSRCYAVQREFENALRSARRWLALDPLHEPAHRLLMRLYAWAGHSTRALRQYRECAALLRSELDAVPGASTRKLHHAIRNNQVPQPPPAVSGGPASTVTAGATADGTLLVHSTVTETGAQSTANEGQLRIVTVVATGLKGASVLLRRPGGGSRESDEGRFTRLITTVVTTYGGELCRTGDGAVHVVFGASTLHENDAELAIRLALEMQRAAHSAGLSVSTGISTGTVYLSPDSGDSHEGLPLPATVIGLAHTLRRRASAGCILAGESTYRSTRAAFTFRESPVAAGTVGSSVRAFEVSGRFPVPRKVSVVEGMQAKLIGREAELTRLRSAFQAARAGHGSVVCIVGEAGVGKSRLIEEVRHEATGSRTHQLPVQEPVYWLEGRCLTTAVTARYWPFLDVIKGLFSFETRDGDARRSRRIQSFLDGLESEGHLTRQEAGESAAVLSELLSVRRETEKGGPLALAGPEQMKHLTFQCIRLLLRALTRRKPVVLVLEDLHWADGLSLDLINHLFESVTDLPILMICVYRPDPTHRSRHLAGIAARKCVAGYVEIVLRELSPVHSAAMADSLIPSGEGLRELKAEVLQRAQGNPLFLEELVRSLVDSGAVVRRGPQWCAGGAPRSVEVPESLQSVILSRVGSLGNDAIRALECAAVIGRLFQRELLAGTSRLAGLDEILEDLQDRELIYEERPVPEEQFSFKHVLTQEAVYKSIPEWRRELIHRDVAAALVDSHPAGLEEHFEQLAFHYDRSRDREKAIEYHYLAGEKARRSNANEEAVAHLTRGLQLLRSAPASDARRRRELEYLIMVGVPLTLSAGHQSPSVESTYERARELCNQLGTSEELFEVLLGLRRLQYGRGAMRVALETSQQMLTIAEELEDAQLLCRAHMMLSEVYCEVGGFHRAVEHGRAGVHLHRTDRDRTDLVRFGNDSEVGCLLFQALGSWYLGYSEQAVSLSGAALSKARALGHPFTLVFSLFFTGFLFMLRREADRAVACICELLGEATTHGFSVYQKCGPVLMAWARAEAGQARESLRVIEAYLRDPRAPQTFRPHFLAALATCYAKTGRINDGIACLTEGLDRPAESNARGWEAELFRIRGELKRLGGLSAESAATDYARACEVSRRQQAKSLELRAATSLSRLLVDQGRRDEARGLLGPVYAGFCEGFDTADLREAAALLAGLKEGE